MHWFSAFQLLLCGDGSMMAVSLSTNEIKLYSSITGQHVGELVGHNRTISEISFSSSDPQQLHSCSQDGTIRTWDLRSRQQVSILQGNSSAHEIFSFSIGGSANHLLAAGSNAQILFWDRRCNSQVACLEECHMEDVTQVCFHPIYKSKLVSASIDGLMCTINTVGQIDDDEQLESVMNPGTSVARIGFFGEKSNKIWCLTHIESLSIWDWDNSSVQLQIENARSLASASWDLPQVDYFVECHYSPASDNLWLIGGTNEGSLGYFSVNHEGRNSHGQGGIGFVGAALQGGHADVIRCTWSPFYTANDFNLSNRIYVWTGGEDGRLCYWSDGEMSTKKKAWVSSGFAIKSSKMSKHCRHHPY
eukprot:TRINITY_DN2921_c0_g1_i2.p1 TRINITY_DN2921_c0_g1~~TRINITY_DN2921_c0_g1_i2.p1  ORF type:complete len:361 (-),score=60.44 TRINITY_DN2921_c0_g1_i2:149-1231(-)